MTSETAVDLWSTPVSAATQPAREALQHAVIDGDHDDACEDVSRMVMAVGALLGWQGAVLLDHTRTDPRRTVVRSWTPSGQPTSSADPDWLWQVLAQDWERKVVLSREVSRRDGSPCGLVAVPVRCGDGVRGALCFYGAGLRQPDVAATGLLEAIAGLLAGNLDRDRRDHLDHGDRDGDGNNAAERVIAMVDVFAYTVRVNLDGVLDWRYFGPNSDVIFGGAVCADAPLTTLVRRFAHEHDAEHVAEFAQALLAGTPMDVEFRVIGLDGVTRWTSWRTVPRHTDGALHVDGVVTDVSSRHALDCVTSGVRLSELGEEQVRTQARLLRDANDNVLQRIFAAGLRLQMLKRKLTDIEAHAVTAIAFQLDQAATDLREVILDLSAVADGSAA